jgi:hypothetical protein
MPASRKRALPPEARAFLLAEGGYGDVIDGIGHFFVMIRPARLT